MKIKACLVSGIEIVGFQVEGNKGELKDYNYQTAITQASLKRIEGVSCKTLNGKKILVGIDYKNLEKVPVQTLESYRTSEPDGEVKGYVKFDDSEEEQELGLGSFWKYCVENGVQEPDCGLITDGNNIFKYVRFGDSVELSGKVEKSENDREGLAGEVNEDLAGIIKGEKEDVAEKEVSEVASKKTKEKTKVENGTGKDKVEKQVTSKTTVKAKTSTQDKAVTKKAVTNGKNSAKKSTVTKSTAIKAKAETKATVKKPGRPKKTDK